MRLRLRPTAEVLGLPGHSRDMQRSVRTLGKARLCLVQVDRRANEAAGGASVLVQVNSHADSAPCMESILHQRQFASIFQCRSLTPCSRIGTRQCQLLGKRMERLLASRWAAAKFTAEAVERHPSSAHREAGIPQLGADGLQDLGLLGLLCTSLIATLDANDADASCLTLMHQAHSRRDHLGLPLAHCLRQGRAVALGGPVAEGTP
mmetsp:Transcript_89332/g.207915  ORF Transcript_89332/g.207915 Transcript_89332/m.207915 type:complete len:206 (-) Transcript_89332:478-1095(-)